MKGTRACPASTLTSTRGHARTWRGNVAPRMPLPRAPTPCHCLLWKDPVAATQQLIAASTQLATGHLMTTTRGIGSAMLSCRSFALLEWIIAPLRRRPPAHGPHIRASVLLIAWLPLRNASDFRPLLAGWARRIHLRHRCIALSTTLRHLLRRPSVLTQPRPRLCRDQVWVKASQ